MYMCNLYSTVVINAEPLFPAFVICQNSSVGNIFPAKLNVVLMHLLLGCSSFAPINLMISHIKTVLRTKNFIKRLYDEKAAMIVATFVSFSIGVLAMFNSKTEDESYSVEVRLMNLLGSTT
uniref:G_PROTEIN_RECEP_F1_2 domain-containing protein n=1 Tax=Panagrellus redivivus TaxID=6233 RepID=A0A7E4WAA6_PANRE